MLFRRRRLENALDVGLEHRGVTQRAIEGSRKEGVVGPLAGQAKRHARGDREWVERVAVFDRRVAEVQEVGVGEQACQPLAEPLLRRTRALKRFGAEELEVAGNLVGGQ